MNPYLWVFVVLFALDALREELGLSSFSSLAEYLLNGVLQWFY